MADSKRKQIVDAFVSAVDGTTGVGTVTQDEETWAQADLQDYALCFVNAQKPEVARAYFEHPTAADMEATMEINVSGQSLSQYGSTKRTDVDTLMKAIEQAIVGDSTLAGLCLDVTLQSDTIDIGSSENLGFFYLEYVVVYQYNHATP